MSALSDLERKWATNSPVYVSEVGIVGGTSSLAAVRARQMAKQREISSATARKMRSDEYLKNLYADEEREKQDEKERARARASQLEEERIEQLAARADRLRLRTDADSDKKLTEAPSPSTDRPWAARRQRRREEQFRRKSDERREQVSNDLARARALLEQERRRDELEIARDISKGYSSYAKPKKSSLRYETDYERGGSSSGSIMKSTNRRRFDLDDDYQPLGRSRLGDDRFSDLTLGRSNGLHRELGSSSLRGTNGYGSRASKEVHWSVGDF